MLVLHLNTLERHYYPPRLDLRLGLQTSLIIKIHAVMWQIHFQTPELQSGGKTLWFVTSTWRSIWVIPPSEKWIRDMERGRQGRMKRWMLYRRREGRERETQRGGKGRANICSALWRMTERKGFIHLKWKCPKNDRRDTDRRHACDVQSRLLYVQEETLIGFKNVQSCWPSEKVVKVRFPFISTNTKSWRPFGKNQ